MNNVVNQQFVVIGHRGVGKSDLLLRLKKYFPDLSEFFFDLDHEIEKKYGQNIAQYFQQNGEERFRQTEQIIFNEIYQSKKAFFLILGAGFDVDRLPANVVKIWLKRETDNLGRIFFNRPRLQTEVTALQEYQNRWAVRDPKFSREASFHYNIPEGLSADTEIVNQLNGCLTKLAKRFLIERDIFSKLFFDNVHDLKNYFVPSVLTLLPEHFREDRISIIKKIQPTYFECRNDLLSSEQIKSAMDQFGPDRILYSFRSNKTKTENIDEYKKNVLQNKISNWDWAVELGECPFAEVNILSLHDLPIDSLKNSADLQNYIQNKVFSDKSNITNVKLKLSPVCETFQQIKTLFDWQQQDPQFRSILPRSIKNPGRWRWFRLFMQNKQQINFFRIDQGSAIDQPYLFQCVSQSILCDQNNLTNKINEKRPTQFAAVLGCPTLHSRSPIQHHQFFSELKMPFYNIDIETEEFESAMCVLKELGLSAAAVTSPLKELAFKLSQNQTIIAKELQSANTLIRSSDSENTKGFWRCHNTDLFGLKAVLSKNLTGFDSSNFDSSTVYVWGGGGTLSVISRLLPQAAQFSLRTGQLRKILDRDTPLKPAQFVIWAAGPQDSMPPLDWRPQLVIDLNYREDSLARQYALQIGAKYIDGLSMFEAQAKAQQEFWSEFHGQ